MPDLEPSDGRPFVRLPPPSDLVRQPRRGLVRRAMPFVVAAAFTAAVVLLALDVALGAGWVYR